MRSILSLFQTFLLLLTVALPGVSLAQMPSAETVLERSIHYHDPSGTWGRFQGHFTVVAETPGRELRYSDISMDQPASAFEIRIRQAGTEKTYALVKDACRITFQGSIEFSAEQAEQQQLTCQRATMWRDYYSYLYGLPMKLRDPGTLLGTNVKEVTFHGMRLLALEVGYAPETGSDLWYFYFDPTTYALRAYQFYHDKAKNDGEYILLEGEVEVGGMRLPAKRSWYYNKDDKFLGTDVLQN